jgi:hypothetical protein
LGPSSTVTVTRTASPTSTPTVTPSPSFSETPSPPPSPSASVTYDRFFQQERLIKLRGLYPNPFSLRLRIYYTLRVDARVALRIYNVAGEPIRVLEMEGRAGKNELEWFGDNASGGRCASGAYLLHLQAQGVDGTVDDFWEQAAIAR